MRSCLVTSVFDALLACQGPSYEEERCPDVAGVIVSALI